MSTLGRPPAGPDGIAELEPLVRRVIRARVSDPPAVEDLTQETLARTLAAQSGLDPTALGPYAVVVARNLVRSQARSEERRQRLSPGLFDPHRPEDPAERAMEAEDRRALAAALDRLSAGDREALFAHHVEGVETTALAEQLGATPKAVGVRLFRARARLRVEYLLALRRVELPTSACKPVLLALSSGDTRRQRALEAGSHLLSCRPCSALSQPLLQRRRPMALLWPALGLERAINWLRRQAREHPAQAVVTGMVALAAVVLIVSSGRDEPARPSPPARPVLFVLRNPPIELSGGTPLAAYAGQEVRAEAAPVESVPTNEGFWVGTSPADRIWVDLDSGQPLSKPVSAGQRVSFAGTLVPNHPELPTQLGLEVPPDRAQLERQGHHISISEETLQITEQAQPTP